MWFCGMPSNCKRSAVAATIAGEPHMYASWPVWGTRRPMTSATVQVSPRYRGSADTAAVTVSHGHCAAIFSSSGRS
jgi:hypothetical protein